MIQDIAPHKLWNEYDTKRRPDFQSLCLSFNKDKQLLATEGEEIRFPTYAEVLTVNPGLMDDVFIYLFKIDEIPYFLVLTNGIAMPEGYTYQNVRDIRRGGRKPQYQAFAAITAFQLRNWYMDNHFCGTCGSATIRGEEERVILCPYCGRHIYPRIVPAVIIGVTNGDKLLVTRYTPEHIGRVMNFDALVAGFTEIGEAFEDTVKREVMEEVGLRVKNIRYYKSQPWGIVDDLLAGFYCDVDGSDEIKRDKKELSSALWLTREEIVGQPDDFSLTNEMMMHFKEGEV